MSVSVRTRFEVFKRDKFTCAYCGHHPPEVLLEADHVLPRAAGGTDDIENLITSCQDCNRGKSDRLLEEGARPVSQLAVADAEERLAQAKAYAEAIQGIRRAERQMEWIVVEAWAEAFGATKSDGGFVFDGEGRFPEEASLRAFLRRLPVADVLEAVDITASRFGGRAIWDSTRYFYGVCWRKVREREAGR